jgi:hypothetical protein
MFGSILMKLARTSEYAQMRLFIIVGMILVRSTIPISSLGDTIVSFLIHFCREIVVDDMQISKVQTLAPTLSPTDAITDSEAEEVTGAPTHSVSFLSLLLILFRKKNSSYVFHQYIISCSRHQCRLFQQSLHAPVRFLSPQKFLRDL